MLLLCICNLFTETTFFYLSPRYFSFNSWFLFFLLMFWFHFPDGVTSPPYYTPPFPSSSFFKLESTCFLTQLYLTRLLAAAGITLWPPFRDPLPPLVSRGTGVLFFYFTRWQNADDETPLAARLTNVDLSWLAVCRVLRVHDVITWRRAPRLWSSVDESFDVSSTGGFPCDVVVQWERSTGSCWRSRWPAARGHGESS